MVKTLFLALATIMKTSQVSREIENFRRNSSAILRYD